MAKTDIKAKLIGYGTRIKSFVTEKTDQVLIGLMIAAFLAVGLLYLTEQTAPSQQVQEPGAYELEEPITTDDELFKEVVNSTKPLDPLEETEYARLITYNVFDAKAARDAEELDQQARELLVQAQQRYEAGEYDEAKRLAEEAVELSPYMRQATELIEKVDTVLAELKEAEEAAEQAQEAVAPEAEG